MSMFARRASSSCFFSSWHRGPTPVLDAYWDPPYQNSHNSFPWCCCACGLEQLLEFTLYPAKLTFPGSAVFLPLSRVFSSFVWNDLGFVKCLAVFTLYCIPYYLQLVTCYFR